MEDDLVKRLRDWETIYPCDADKPDGSLYVEAADRIAELEAALDAIANLNSWGRESWWAIRAKAIARAALGEKTDG